ncbi:hypothetical protein NM688_g3627 [Phlebia brevispora]|uniref:Uncharacterized protein n=1 Tax=Phlebia brevispora TaxID=194682 RepID=A0ACC1T597_9APHY|nr:hypothetical protein NM688_g3627 [Phlebia brevispora]
MSTLIALSDIISSGIEKIAARCAASGDAYPTLDDPYTLANNSVQSRYASDAAPIIAAAYQLIATLSNPDPYLFTWGLVSFFNASVAVASEGCVPDILREAGPKGLHVDSIAAKNKMDPGKLGRILRLLASRHVFTEVSPDVFCNNRISKALCTGNSPTVMMEKPLERWNGSNGTSAMAEWCGIDALKMAAFLVDNVTDPETAHSQEPNKASVQRVFNTDIDFHSWQQKPENAYRRNRFQHMMRSLTYYSSEDASSGGVEWASLPPKSIVVDVGGGIGTLTMDLVAQHQHINYVVQDLPSAIAQARTYWSTTNPDALRNGQVHLREHDFFAPQPLTNPSVYMLRYIMHNWPDAYCIKILSHLRDAAGPSTQLFVLDHILDYLSRDTTGLNDDIPGAARPMAPEPLLPYPDSVTEYGYLMDILMMGELNSQERTLKHFETMFRKAGWKLERVCRFPAPHPQQLICSPL